MPLFHCLKTPPAGTVPPNTCDPSTIPATLPVPAAVVSATFPNTSVMRLLMITYYVDNTTTPGTPRLTRVTNLAPPQALAGVVAYLCLGKVLSPQYVLWVAPLAPLAWVFRQRLVAILLAIAAGLTQWLFPAHYTETVVGAPPGVTVTAIRDLILVAVLLILLGSALRGARVRNLPAAASASHPPGAVVTAAPPG